MKFLYHIRTILDIDGTNNHKDFCLFFTDKNGTINIDEKERLERVERITRGIIRKHNLANNPDNCLMYISGPFTEESEEIQFLRNSLEYQIFGDVGHTIKSILIGLMSSIICDERRNIYELEYFNYGDKTPLNLLVNNTLLHILYLDEKQMLHKSYDEYKVRDDFSNIYYTNQININILTKQEYHDNLLQSAEDMIKILDKKCKIVFLIPETWISLSFTFELTKLIMRYNERVSLCTKVSGTIYKIVCEGDILMVKRYLTSQN